MKELPCLVEIENERRILNHNYSDEGGYNYICKSLDNHHSFPFSLYHMSLNKEFKVNGLNYKIIKRALI